MLRFKARPRKGKWADSPNNPERRKARRVRVEKKEHRITSLEGFIRREIENEVGEDIELSRLHRLAVLQKYGMVKAFIDRHIDRPLWMGEEQWKQIVRTWYKLTKGLGAPPIPRPTRFTTRPVGVAQSQSQPFTRNNQSRRNFQRDKDRSRYSN